MDKKTESLQRIYGLYDEQIEPFDLACKKFCADCCTANVTMTRLEGMLIRKALDEGAKTDLMAKLSARLSPKRFRPKLTTNSLAEYCCSGAEPPAEAAEEDAGTCPFLESDACTIYSIRPFACRCMISSRSCRTTGEAEIDPFLLTLNTVFLQFIEHLDVDGFFGNMADVLHCLEDHPDGSTRVEPLIATCHITALMVPQEHRKQITPVITAMEAACRS